MPRQANLDNPIYAGLTSREVAALRRDYAHACAAEPTDAVTEAIKRSGLAAFALGWITSYRLHRGKHRRARWPDEERKPETADEVRTRKHAARLRKAQAA